MTPEQRELARHALGLDNPKAGRTSYRNRFFAGRGHPAWDALHDMVGAGWMNLEDEPDGKQTRFWLTTRGAMMALNPGESLDREDFPNAPA